MSLRTYTYCKVCGDLLLVDEGCLRCASRAARAQSDEGRAWNRLFWIYVSVVGTALAVVAVCAMMRP